MFTTVSPLGEAHFSLFPVALDHLCDDARHLERRAEGEHRDQIAMARRAMRLWEPGDHVYEIPRFDGAPPIRFEVRS